MGSAGLGDPAQSEPGSRSSSPLDLHRSRRVPNTPRSFSNSPPAATDTTIHSAPRSPAAVLEPTAAPGGPRSGPRHLRPVHSAQCPAKNWMIGGRRWLRWSWRRCLSRSSPFRRSKLIDASLRRSLSGSTHRGLVLVRARRHHRDQANAQRRRGHGFTTIVTSDQDRSCVLCRARLARDRVDVGHTRSGPLPGDAPSDRGRPDRRHHALRRSTSGRSPRTRATSLAIDQAGHLWTLGHDNWALPPRAPDDHVHDHSDRGQSQRTSTPPGGSALQTISVGRRLRSGARTSGKIWAWGNNDEGNLASTPVAGSRPDRSGDTARGDFTAVAAGITEQSVALDSHGRAWDWETTRAAISACDGRACPPEPGPARANFAGLLQLEPAGSGVFRRG